MEYGYTGGTVTVAEGSTTVEGAGVFWGANLRAGDTFEAAGDRVSISSADNDTLTLARPWAGAALAGAAGYVIRYDSPRRDTIDLGLKVRELIRELQGAPRFVPLDNPPDNSAGEEGQFGIVPETSELFLKVGGIWVSQGQALGVAWLDGAGIPDDANGKGGDFYLRHNGEVYRKEGDAWDLKTSIKGEKGDQGERGPVSGIKYTFEAATASAAPANGALRLNGTMGAATAIYASTNSADGSAMATWLDGLGSSTNPADKGTLTISKETDASVFVDFKVTGAVTSQTGRRTVPGVVTAFAGAFAANDVLALRFSRSGNKGVDGNGAGDVIGPASAVIGSVAVFSEANGKQIEGGPTLGALASLNTVTATQIDSNAVTFGKLATAAIANQAQAEAGTATNVVMTPQRVAQAIAALTEPGAPDDLELAVSLLALQLADLTNQGQGLGNRFADSFDTLTYVDVAGATNLDTSVVGVLKATVPSAQVSGSHGAAPGTWFDGTVTGANSGAFATDYTEDFGSGGRTIVRMRVYGPDGRGPGTNPGTATLALSGSNDGSSFTPLTLSNPSVTNNATGQVWDCTVQSPANYRYYRYRFTNTASDGSLFLAEVQFFENVAPNNATVRSAALDLGSAPAKMRILARLKVPAGFVIGSDIAFDVSRNDGATWAAAGVAQVLAQAGSMIVVQSAWIDVSGQASGSNLRWRWRTLTNKAIELHDTYLMARAA